MLNRIMTALLLFACLLCEVVRAGSPTAYVINTSSETMDKINVTTHAVTHNITTLGSDIDCYPNQIIVRDTMAYIVNSGTDEIQIINLITAATAGWIDLPNGSNPYWMDFLNDSILYVSLMVTNSVAKVNVVSRTVEKITEVGLSPEGVLVFDGKLYIAITAYDFNTWSWGQGKVAVYDPAADVVINEILVGTNPQNIDFDHYGRLHVVCTGNYWDIPGIIYIIDPAAATIVDSIAIGGQPAHIAINNDNVAFLDAGGWVDDGEVLSYDALTGDIFHGASNPMYVDSGAIGVAVFQDGSAFVLTFGDRISRIHADGSVAQIYHMGDGPIDMDFDYIPGDANADWEANVADAVFLINYIFKSGPSPVDPAWRANPNGDNGINVGDAVYLINYVFSGGPRPLVGPTSIIGYIDK